MQPRNARAMRDPGHCFTLRACMALFCSSLLLLGPSLPATEQQPWQTTVQREHPLVGKIWDVRAEQFITRETLGKRITAKRFVLLGEKHDNPDHHRLQAWALQSLIQAGRKPAVAFEMFDKDVEPAIVRHLASAPADADGLAVAANWEKSGWPDWSYYRPIVETALSAGLPIAAANFSRSATKKLGQEGLEALDSELVRRLGLAKPLDPDVRASMAEEIREAHCGYATDEIVARMIPVQRARDAQMAETLLSAGQETGAVLIAGGGHVRKDRGVPALLAAQSQQASIVSLGFLEVNREKTEPPAYAESYGAQQLPFDYVFFTPRVDELDPCEKARPELEKLRKKD